MKEVTFEYKKPFDFPDHYMEEAKKVFLNIQYVSNPCEVADGADAMIPMTEWNLFRNLDMDQIKGRLKSSVFIDLSNVYEPKKMADLGFRSVSVGRPKAQIYLSNPAPTRVN
jgi:UDPglucose 6-dehydrogenase